MLELSKVHSEESKKELMQAEVEYEDYKREVSRTEETISSMRQDPGWRPLPTLGQKIGKIVG